MEKIERFTQFHINQAIEYIKAILVSQVPPDFVVFIDDFIKFIKEIVELYNKAVEKQNTYAIETLRFYVNLLTSMSNKTKVIKSILNFFYTYVALKGYITQYDLVKLRLVTSSASIKKWKDFITKVNDIKNRLLK